MIRTIIDDGAFCLIADRAEDLDLLQNLFRRINPGEQPEEVVSHEKIKEIVHHYDYLVEMNEFPGVSSILKFRTSRIQSDNSDFLKPVRVLVAPKTDGPLTSSKDYHPFVKTFIYKP